MWCTNSLTLKNCRLCPYCIYVYVFCICLRTNSDLCHLQHKLIGFFNRDEKCLLRGTDWAFKLSGLRFVIITYIDVFVVASVVTELVHVDAEYRCWPLEFNCLCSCCSCSCFSKNWYVLVLNVTHFLFLYMYNTYLVWFNTFYRVFYFVLSKSLSVVCVVW
jgi:hypothetical protein